MNASPLTPQQFAATLRSNREVLSVVAEEIAANAPRIVSQRETVLNALRSVQGNTLNWANGRHNERRFTGAPVTDFGAPL